MSGNFRYAAGTPGFVVPLTSAGAAAPAVSGGACAAGVPVAVRISASTPEAAIGLATRKPWP